MTFTRHITSLAAATLLTATSFTVTPQAQPLPAPGGAATITVPMLDFGGRPVLSVSIDGAGPYRMIFDTGADRTVVFPGWVDNASGRLTLKNVKIGDLVLPSMPASSQQLFGGQVPEEFPKGVMSALAFPGYVVAIDYIKKTVSFTKGALPTPDGKTVFGYPATERLPMVPVRVGGKTFNIHVDTGSPGGVTLPVKASESLELVSPLTKTGRARTNSGEFDVFKAPVKGGVKVGTFTLDLPLVTFSDVSPNNQPGPGNLGFEVLKGFVVSIDSANRRVKLER